MEYSITPSLFFVGDRVQLSIQLGPSYTSSNSTFKLEKLEETPDITINAISIVHKDASPYLVIEFTPWQTGYVRFPSLTPIGLDLALPKLEVPSILDEAGVSASLQDARGPILSDGTVFMIYKNIGSVLLCLLAFSFVFLFLKKKGSALFSSFLDRYALLLFGLSLKKLQHNLNNILSLQTSGHSALSAHLQLSKEKHERLATWSKSYEASFRVCLASIYRRKANINWAALTYSEMEKLIAESIESQPLISDEEEEMRRKIMQNIHQIFACLSIIRFGRNGKARGSAKDVKGVSTTLQNSTGREEELLEEEEFLEEELLTLSSHLITLHKKRKARSKHTCSKQREAKPDITRSTFKHTKEKG